MAEDDGLPTDFDVIVLGTGMPESILAAAAARLGQTVLHIDRNEYYGGAWASFNFDQIFDWINYNEQSQVYVSETPDYGPHLKEGEIALPPSCKQWLITNVIVTQNIPDEAKSVEEEEKPITENCDEVTTSNVEGSTTANLGIQKDWTLKDLKDQKRKFNLDLAPKLLFSRGPLVELLISSNISRYTEFKSATRVLTFIDDKLLQVPCSRADVFSTKDVSIVEKRMLMKFLNFCYEFKQHPEEYQDYECKSFREFLKSKKLTSNVEHYLLHAIAMVDPSISTLEALEKIQKFLASLGRYGNSPFLWPIYGCGELPQCFCRLCAVFGGIYYLNKTVDAVIMNDQKECTGLISGGKRINCKWLIMDPSFAPKSLLHETTNKRISRGIFITDSSILQAEKEQLTLLRMPAELVGSTTTVIELGPGTCVCPKGLYVVQMTSESKLNTAQEDLSFTTSKLFKNSQTVLQDSSVPVVHVEDEGNLIQQPSVLWSVTYNQWLAKENLSERTLRNVFLVTFPDAEQDYEAVIQQVKDIFNTMNPGADFLPRAPDPDEVILETSENNSTETEQPNSSFNGLNEN